MVDRPVAFITGSTSGIGEATARRFAAEGYRVVLNSSQSVAAGEALAAALPDALYVQGAVHGDMDAVALVDRVLHATGRLDVLVNNAGVTKQIPHQDVEAATVDVFRSIFEVNVFGTWALSVAALPALRERSGAIVNVSSIAGLRQTGSSIPYAASKAALNHLTTLLAKVVGPEVRVNAVCPGLIDTPWTADWDVVRQFVAALAPLKRSGQPDDVAGLIYALATLPYLTGQLVAVDGGLTLTQ
jgi:ketoreductase RED2